MNLPTAEQNAVPEKLRGWLRRAVESGASDLHLVAGYPPVLRLHGDLIELSPSCNGRSGRSRTRSRSA
jgi:Tfp pilus assembly pilus retraction ATPase PilT